MYVIATCMTRIRGLSTKEIFTTLQHNLRDKMPLARLLLLFMPLVLFRVLGSTQITLTSSINLTVRQFLSVAKHSKTQTSIDNSEPSIPPYAYSDIV